MGIPTAQFEAMVARMKKNPVRDGASSTETTTGTDRANERESVLHARIMEYCDSQWPRWKFIHARMDERSTIAVGAPDFTIFIPGGKTLCIECKRKGQKPTVQQSAWRMEMNRIGHDIKLITSMDEFMDVVKGMLP